MEEVSGEECGRQTRLKGFLVIVIVIVNVSETSSSGSLQVDKICLVWSDRAVNIKQKCIPASSTESGYTALLNRFQNRIGTISTCLQEVEKATIATINYGDSQSCRALVIGKEEIHRNIDVRYQVR